MKPDEINKLLSSPESDVLEFKTRLSDVELTAKVISAFANTKGGKLIVGVKDGGEIIGIENLVVTEQVIGRALRRISPQVKIETETVNLDGKTVLIATVLKGQEPPYFVDGQAYQRQDDRISIINVFAPDVYGSAYEAIVSGSGAVAQGDGAIAVGQDAIFIGDGTIAQGEPGIGIGNATVIQASRYIETNIIGYDKAYERVVGSTTFVLNQLELNYRQTREQSQWWFRASIIAAGIGFVLIGIGITTVIFGQTTAGIITAISSVIPNAAAALFFIQSKTANERVDIIQGKLSDAREVYAAVEIVNTIDDLKARDKLKAEIVRKALKINKK